MNQIEELEKLYVKKKSFKIPKNPRGGEPQANIELIPLSLEDSYLVDIDKEGSSEDKIAQLMKLMAHTLCTSEDAVKKISFAYLKDIQDAMGEINNFDKDDKEKVDKVMGFIKDKKGAANGTTGETEKTDIQS